jgi:HPt (histidine-containing phosphotransfer) domain-containing protein
MAYDPGAIDAALAAAVGDDAALIAELRAAFLDSADRYAEALGRSRCDANWQQAACRLKGLAASFGAVGLMRLADVAGEGAPGDPVILRDIRLAIGEIAR